METELTQKHIENLRAIAASDGGMISSKTPHPHNVRYLVKHEFAEKCGDDWIALVTITPKGREVLKGLDE